MKPSDYFERRCTGTEIIEASGEDSLPLEEKAVCKRE